MTFLTTLDEFNIWTKHHTATMVYFSQNDCSVCKVIKPQLQEMIASTYPHIQWAEVDCVKHVDLPAQLGVLVVPTVLLFFEGKEQFRKYRNLSIKHFEQEIQRVYTLVFS